MSRAEVPDGLPAAVDIYDTTRRDGSQQEGLSLTVEDKLRVAAQREDGGIVTEATIKVHVGDDRIVATADGNGPVNALDAALRQAIGSRYPALAGVHLTDYNVRVFDTAKARRP